MTQTTLLTDYSNPQHAQDIVTLLNAYAKDPMGGEESLSAHPQEHLVSEVAKLPHAFSVICYVDGEPVGLANCFDGFSTFACKPLVNIHDLAVLREFRGRGISQILLAEVEQIARQKGCCKITLEVLAVNALAQNAYSKYGFGDVALNATTKGMLFWQKTIS